MDRGATMRVRLSDRSRAGHRKLQRAVPGKSRASLHDEHHAFVGRQSVSMVGSRQRYLIPWPAAPGRWLGDNSRWRRHRLLPEPHWRTITYTAAANPDRDARSAALLIGGQTHLKLNQPLRPALACTAHQPSTHCADACRDAGTGTLTVTAPDGWLAGTASSTDAWLLIIGGAPASANSGGHLRLHSEHRRSASASARIEGPRTAPSRCGNPATPGNANISSPRSI